MATQLAVQLDQLGFHPGTAVVRQLANAGGAVLLAADRCHDFQQHFTIVPAVQVNLTEVAGACLLYTSPSPRD